MVAKKTAAPTYSLKFLVQDIPQEGFHLTYDVGQEELDLTPDEGRIHDKLHVDCDVRHSSEGVVVKGTLSGTIIRECVRCLTEYHDMIVLPCVGLFQDGHSPPSQSSVVVQDDDEYDSGLGQVEEIYHCYDHRIELDVMLREQVILVTPIQRLCQADCRGLCEHCGINCNLSSCSCAETVHFSPMVAAFQQLKKKR